MWTASARRRSVRVRQLQSGNFPGIRARRVLTEGNPDAVSTTAVAAGATVVCLVRDQDDGWYLGRLVDPFGHHKEIVRRIG